MTEGYSRKPKTCEGCDAFEWGIGFVPPLIPRRPTNIAFVGQGPGQLEAYYNEPFLPTAPAGKSLTEWMYLAELQRTEVLITNSVQCWLPEAKPKGVPKGNRNPTPAEREFCWHRHLGPLLYAQGFDQPDKWIFTVGAPASEFFLGIDKGVEKHLGTVNVRPLPSYDPDFRRTETCDADESSKRETSHPGTQPS